MRRRLSAPACAAALFAALAAGCHDGRTPTDTVALPVLTGTWNGDFAAGPVGLRAGMQLSQSGAGNVSGTLTIFPNTVGITGTVSSTQLTFHTTGSCPMVTGTLTFTMTAGAVTAMSGPATQSFAACIPNAQGVPGTLSLTPQH
ncbi:MAG TPA: hypothetical protein VGE98_03115 [Thermoanaerobaculia bacterium]